MTAWTTALAVGWAITLLAYAWLLSRYKAMKTPTRTLPIFQTSGAMPDAPFVLELGDERLVVVAVADDRLSMRVRERRWTDRVRFAVQRARHWLGGRLSK